MIDSWVMLGWESCDSLNSLSVQQMWRDSRTLSRCFETNDALISYLGLADVCWETLHDTMWQYTSWLHRESQAHEIHKSLSTHTMRAIFSWGTSLNHTCLGQRVSLSKMQFKSVRILKPWFQYQFRFLKQHKTTVLKCFFSKYKVSTAEKL